MRKQQASCPHYGKRFSRQDSLKRYMPEQNHGARDGPKAKYRADPSLKEHVFHAQRLKVK
jgi:hypothetical protein